MFSCRDDEFEFNSSYIPDIVQKAVVLDEKDATKERDDSSDDIESIDFPFTTPPPMIDTPEYHEDKKNKIRIMIEKNINLNVHQQQVMISMLHKYADRFSLEGENIERNDVE